MNRARPGWKAYTVTAGGWAALSVLSISIGNGWLGAAQLALAAATGLYAFVTFRKTRQAMSESAEPQDESEGERRDQ